MCWTHHREFRRQAWSVPREEARAPTPVRTPGDLRVSDAERQAVIDQLRRHTGDGRLTLEEFEQRADEAIAARTGDELRAVLRELPLLHDERARRPARPRSRPTWVPRVAMVVAVLVGISLLAGHLVIWPLFPIAFFWFGGGGCGRRHHVEHEARETRDRDDTLTYA